MSTVPSHPGKLLIVRLGAIGDALRVLPAVARIRRDRPDTEIGWAVEHWVYPALKDHPLIDRFHVIDRRELRAGLRRAGTEAARVAGEIQAEGYDVLLDFHGRLKTGVLAALSRVPVSVGFAAGQSSEMNHWFMNNHVRLGDVWENRVLRFLHLLAPLGVDTDYDPQDHGLHIPPGLRESATSGWQGSGAPPVAVFPGCSAGRAAERWPAERWGDLLAALGQHGAGSMVFWGPAEEELAAEVVGRSEGAARMAPATTLPEMMAWLGLFAAFVGTDTAAMHMAWMQGVPTAVFMGPKPVRTASPLAPVPFRVLRAPGYPEDVPLPRSKSEELVCGVSVEQALGAVRELLKSPPRPAD